MQTNNIEALFFPSKENEKKLIDFLDKAKQSIKICVYTFTNRNIVSQIVALAKANPDLRVQVITDDVQTLIPSQKAQLDKLVEEGLGRIEVKVDISKVSLMHNKYVILDNDYVATGSFNWTMKAVTTNRENLLLIKDSALAQIFAKNFEEQWNLFIKLGEAPPPPVIKEKKPKAVKPAKAPKEPKTIKQKIAKQINSKKKTSKKQESEEEDDDFDPEMPYDDESDDEIISE